MAFISHAPFLPLVSDWIVGDSNPVADSHGLLPEHGTCKLRVSQFAASSHLARRSIWLGVVHSPSPASPADLFVIESNGTLLSLSGAPRASVPSSPPSWLASMPRSASIAVAILFQLGPQDLQRLRGLNADRRLAVPTNRHRHEHVMPDPERFPFLPRETQIPSRFASVAHGFPPSGCPLHPRGKCGTGHADAESRLLMSRSRSMFGQESTSDSLSDAI